MEIIQEEIWSNVPDYEELYKISTLGRVRNKKGKFKSFFINECGYLYVILYKNNKQRACRVSRLVALTFIPNPHNLPEVNHIKGDKLDNRKTELEWSSISSNRKHAWDLGLNYGNSKKKII